MTGRRMRTGAALLLAVVLAAVALVVPVADAQEAPADPATEVLAILSPIASPVCNASGVSTLLVPIVGGIVDDGLGIGGGPITVGDLLLDSLGPVFIACGSLPAPDGTRCELLDGQIAGLWPEDLNGVGLTSPGVGGNLVEGVARALAVLGLPPLTALEAPLECAVPADALAPEAPPAPPPASVPLDDNGAPVIGSDPVLRPPSSGAGAGSPSLGSTPSVALGTAVQPGAPPTSGTVTVAEVVFRSVPGGVVVLQLLVAAALVAYLLQSWYRSWLLARAGGR